MKRRHVCARLETWSLPSRCRAPAAPEPGLGGDVIGLILRSSLVAKIVLLILVVFSIVSWGIILYKLWAFRRAERHSATFLDVFRKSSKFSEVQAVCKTLGDSPLVGIFQAGYAELNTQLRQPGRRRRPFRGPRPRPFARRCTACRPSTARCCGRRRSR